MSFGHSRELHGWFGLDRPRQRDFPGCHAEQAREVEFRLLSCWQY